MCLLLQGWKDSRLVRWLRKGLRRRRRNARRNQEVLRLRGSGHQRQGLFLLGGEKPGATAATAATAARTQSDPLGKTPNKAGSPSQSFRPGGVGPQIRPIAHQPTGINLGKGDIMLTQSYVHVMIFKRFYGSADIMYSPLLMHFSRSEKFD